MQKITKNSITVFCFVLVFSFYLHTYNKNNLYKIGYKSYLSTKRSNFSMCDLGEVPNLFEGDTYEAVQTGCRGDAGKVGINPADRDAVYYFFINRVRGKLHLCICMSPVGEAFR